MKINKKNLKRITGWLLIINLPSILFTMIAALNSRPLLEGYFVGWVVGFFCFGFMGLLGLIYYLINSD
jgi:hypothetical protein